MLRLHRLLTPWLYLRADCYHCLMYSYSFITHNYLHIQQPTSLYSNKMYLLQNRLWYADLIQVKMLLQFMKVVDIHHLSSKFCTEK